MAATSLSTQPSTRHPQPSATHTLTHTRPQCPPLHITHKHTHSLRLAHAANGLVQRQLLELLLDAVRVRLLQVRVLDILHTANRGSRQHFAEGRRNGTPTGVNSGTHSNGIVNAHTHHKGRVDPGRAHAVAANAILDVVRRQRVRPARHPTRQPRLCFKSTRDYSASDSDGTPPRRRSSRTRAYIVNTAPLVIEYANRSFRPTCTSDQAATKQRPSKARRSCTAG